MRLGDISVAYVELMANTISSQGHNPKLLLERYLLDAVHLSSAHARVSIPRFMRLGHSCIEAFNLPWLGLAMGANMRAPHLGLAGLLAQSAPTLKEACTALTRYELLSSFNARGRSQFILSKQQAVVQFYSISPYNAYNLFVVDSVLAGWVNFITQLCGKNNIFAAAEFEFPAPSYAEHYAKYFPCEIKFNQPRNALCLNLAALELPVLSACASTYAGLEEIARRELEKVKLGLSLREKTERAIGPLLNGQTPTIEQVAQRLNTTPWSLRRKLTAEGHSFQEILNDTRKDLAVSYVRDTQLTLGEIAYVLGFGSAVAFQRAFKRWTGEAPGRFREQRLKD